MLKLAIRSLGTAAILALSAVSAHADDRLFSLDPPRNKALGLDASYHALADNPATASLRLAEVNPGVLREKAASLVLNLEPGLELRAHRIDSYRNPSGSLVWSGVIENPDGLNVPFSPKSLEFDAVNSAMLVRNGDKITGNVHFNGEWYQIRPLKTGGHAIVEVDESLLPPDHPESYKDLPVIPMKARPDQAKAKPQAKSTITVMVNYTPFAGEKLGDVDGAIDLAVAEANQGYANSGVLIDLVLVHKGVTPYVEDDMIETDLFRYGNPIDGRMDEVHAARDAHQADVMILLLDNRALQACGVASGIGSNAPRAFAVVHWQCATGNYTFAHEIGHLLAARHDPDNDPNVKPYAYGHGYRNTKGTRWRTIMAVACQDSPCPRVNYWSNPQKKYNRQPMGTAAKNNNARVLNLTRKVMAGYR